MLIVEMTEQTRDELLEEIEEIQSDIWDLKTKNITKLECCIDEIDSRLEIFKNDLEIELMDYED